jgi:hypothetical protein
MKAKHLLLMSIAIAFVMFSCFDPPVEESSEGTLEFRMLLWNSYESEMQKTAVDTYTCPIVDIRHLIPLIQFTKDTIYHEGPANQEWINFYESDMEMYHSERNMSAVLDTGTYRGVRIFQRVLFYWVCTHPDNPEDTMEFAQVNTSDPYGIELDDPSLNDTIVNIFGIDGLYYNSNDTLYNMNYTEEGGGDGDMAEGEYIGCYFKIYPGRTTRVTVRMNLNTLDWLDINEDGIFTPLDYREDAIDNIRTFADSIITMSDFIVEYLP